MLSTYACSMLLLGIASLIIVAYGWHVSGPALVAQSDASSRRQEFVDSLVLKSLLAVAVSAVGVGDVVLPRGVLALQLLWAESVPRVLGITPDME